MPAAPDVSSVLTVSADASVTTAGTKVARLHDLATDQLAAPTMTAEQLAEAVRRICEVGAL